MGYVNLDPPDLRKWVNIWNAIVFIFIFENCLYLKLNLKIYK
jgi:hypothetical protein